MSNDQTYTAGPAKIQSLNCAALLVCLFAAGCGQVSMPLGSADVETPLVITGSLASPTESAFTDVGAEDRQIIAYTLDLAVDNGSLLALEDSDGENRLTWSNPQSGNSGKVSDIDKSAFADTGCVGFRTTANTIEGVRIYKGSACRDISQRMTITSLAASDA